VSRTAAEPVSFARYTGQETAEQRQALAANPPDILLTNYVMLELMLTRHSAPDPQLIEQAQGLRFLVLDELASRPDCHGCVLKPKCCDKQPARSCRPFLEIAPERSRATTHQP
jgi:hypothetical protein